MQEWMEAGPKDPVRVEIAELNDSGVLLQRFAGDRELMREVVLQFIGVISEERQILNTTSESLDDSEECAKRVHSLASSLSPFGLPHLSRRCIEVESALLNGEKEQACAGLVDLCNHLDELEGTLRGVQPTP